MSAVQLWHGHPFIQANECVNEGCCECYCCCCCFFDIRRRFKCFRSILFRLFRMMERRFILGALFFQFLIPAFCSLRSRLNWKERPNRLNQEFSDWHICALRNDDDLIVHIFYALLSFILSLSDNGSGYWCLENYREIVFVLLTMRTN